MLSPTETSMICRMIRGEELDVARIAPRVVPIISKYSDDARLFRWAALHWAVPTSAGYGRRLRFLILDAGNNDALIGVVGLCDPVYSLSARDRWIGWSDERKSIALTGVMDAYILGAVPPYATLCGGKLVALLATSQTVRDLFRKKYAERSSAIRERPGASDLTLITTTSALGRSSLYNRLKYLDQGLAYRLVGTTAGTGDFQFTGEVYEEIREVAHRSNSGRKTYRHERWEGTGFRNRRETLQRGLKAVGLDPEALRVHGIRRQIYVASLAHNSRELLLGTGEPARWYNRSDDEIGAWWRRRWAEPRAVSQPLYADFNPESWRLWGRMS